MTITVTAPDEQIDLFGDDGITFAPPAATGTVPGVWTAFIQERDGTIVQQVYPLKWGTLSLRKGEWPNVSIEVSSGDTAALAAAQRWVRELAIYRNGRLMFVGPIMGKKASGSAGTRTIRASGVMRYLSKRVRIAEELVEFNFFRNPSFTLGDDHLSAWGHGSGVSASNADSEDGDYAALLDAGETLTQTVLMWSIRALYTVDIFVRVKVPEACTPGKVISVSAPGAGGGASYAEGHVTASTPRDVWTTIHCELQRDGTQQPQSSFYCSIHGLSGGQIKVDTAVFTIIGIRELLEEIGDIDLPEPDRKVDAAVVASNAVLAASNDLFLGVDFMVTGMLTPEPGATPQIVLQAVEAASKAGNFEYGVIANRFIRTFKIRKRLGRVVPEAELVLSPNPLGDAPPNCLDYEWDEDAGDARNGLWATGSDGRFGFAQDLDGWDAFPLQDVVAGPSDMDANALSSWASGELVTSSEDAVALRLIGVEGACLEVVTEFDDVWAVIDDEDTQVEGSWAIVDMTINPATDSFDLALNTPKPR